MSQIVLHLGKEYIEEDLEYYFSGERDKNNQIRPDEKIYSMTPLADHIDIDFNDGKVGNFFYPLPPNVLDRIYIGISVSLFANHWGSSFLLELLKQVKPGGAIILPVYPEGQAAEKGFWSRSFLENTFLSRTRWRGMSNISAENDGVMSLKVGRKWPEPIPSTIEWFYRERSNLLLEFALGSDSQLDTKACVRQALIELSQLIWQEYTSSAVIERIIADNFGRNHAVSVLHAGKEYGLLLNDLMLSQYVNVQSGTTWHLGENKRQIMDSVSQYFAPLTRGRHSLHERQDCEGLFQDSADVMIMNNLYPEVSTAEYEKLIDQAWKSLPANGLLIVHEDVSSHEYALTDLDRILQGKGGMVYYSSIAGCEIKPDYDLSQYSVAVEENLRQEKNTKDNVFRLLQKSA